ncbi:MAG: hypothetical protein ACOYMB_00270 [Patescibacteria group bacterium]
MFYLRLSVLLLPILTLVCSQFLIFFPNIFFLVLILIPGMIAFWCFSLLKKKKTNINQWWKYSLLPVIFHLSSILYFSITPNLFVGQLVLLFNTWFQFNYLKNIYYLLASSEIKEEQLKNISFFGGVAVIFFSASAAYGLRVFLGYPIIPILLGLLVFLSAAWYQIFIFSNLSIKKNLDFFLIALLILSQFATVLFFLPFNYQLLGMIMTITFYFVVGVGRFYLQGEIPEKRLRYYLLFSTLAVFLLVLTARWL